MPTRSNEFQRFIRLLEEHLAPQGAIVEESVMIADLHDGTLHEVDIIVRIPIGERVLTIGIEAQDHKRRADLHWIERLKSKFDLLPIDRRVAVSRRGYSKAAIVKAKLWGIEALSLEAATTLKWIPKLLQLESLIFEGDDYEIVAGRLLSMNLHEGQGRPKSFPPSSKLTIRQPDGASAAVGEIIRSSLRMPELLSKIESVAGDATLARVQVRITFPPGYLVADATGVDYVARGLLVEVVRKRSISSAQLTHHAYGAAAIATGQGKVSDIGYQVALSETERGRVKGSTTLIFEKGTQLSDVKIDGNRFWVTREKPPAE